MTINVQVNKAIVLGNGSQTQFAFGFIGVAAVNTSFAIGKMDSAATALSNATHFLQTGEVPLDSRGGRFLNWWKGNEAPLEGPIPMPMPDPRRMADGERIPFPMSDPRNQPPDFPDGVPLPTRDPRRMADGSRLPAFPMADPRKEEGESWQPIDGNDDQKTVEVKMSPEPAELTTTIIVEAGSELIAIKESVKSLVAKVSGMLSTNGPGSAGHSSPDAAAPRPSSGASTGP
jgi:hypothetical protein